MRIPVLAVAAAAAMACGAAHADIDNYIALLYGINEVGGGDPDGYGLATVSINEDTDVISWAILASNIGPATLAHIHEGAAGTNGPVRIDFDGMFNGSKVAPFTDNITPTTAAGFYVNVHTAAYPNGAIRGQLRYVDSVSVPVPEPETYGLMLAGLGIVGFVAARRSRRAA